MSAIKKIMLAGSVTLLMVIIALVTVGRTTVSAQGTDQQDNQEQNTSAAYTYVAQPGDSYSLIARKAVQTYGLTNKVNLSEAQIIFAETNLTQAAGSPTLVQGQKVEIKEDAIKEWVEKAEDLSQEKQNAWNTYALRANFNTDKVGQS